ncbi:NS1 [California sea lion bocavirus 1]|uniref:Initiator protein NS1 n=2 Tax=Bocaparvovirus pinniped1 TaxID=3052038 RepID=G1JYW6_9VIRU|nr:NS1 [California sea lion bocavirus 1]AEM37589.1 NS1 [California sea lion bocavirus 1]AEM37593.1 NS1 [California sea lion bocavirus 1]AEM37601.1 NS1 [California sea lion bocavirus 1]AEM37610.1 NS1 [California sea lion bocavirus 2]
MALPLATTADIIQFAEPAYTYILTFPYDNWRNHESRIQRSLGFPTGDILDDPSVFDKMPGPETPEEQIAFLETRGPIQSYPLLLARTAYMAAYNVFAQKQGKSDPAASIYAQCELGERRLHVHLVIGGDGLNRYSAKAWRAQLLYKWLDNIQQQLEYNVKYGHTTDKPFCDVLIQACYQVKQRCVDLRADYCEILQYQSRNGDKYACRIDPREFICNYLLPKNLKYLTCIDPDKATPMVSFFACTEKTYAATFINGKWVDIQQRKSMLQSLRDTVVTRFEPKFSGDIFTDLPKVPKANWQESNQPSPSSKMTKREMLMLDCIDRCEKDNLLTYEDLVDNCSALLVMLESQPGGGRLIENLLQMVHIRICQKHTALSYIQLRYSDEPLLVENKAYQLFAIQGYNAWQAGHWLCCVLNKTAGKQNTVNFYGPASTGKTNMAKAIVQAVKLYGCVNHQNKNFLFNDCASKLVCWWEECVMNSEWVEQSKCILGGTEFRIDRKHKDSMLLPQTPVMISTNNDIYTVVGGNTVTGVHSKPLRERVVQFNFMKQLPSTFGEIPASDVVALLLECIKKFPDVSLAGFCAQWKLDKVPNDFPLANICAGHTQDLILYEHGQCTACGTYYPLEERDRGEWELGRPEPRSPEFKVPGRTPTLALLLTSDSVDVYTNSRTLSTVVPPNTPEKRPAPVEEEPQPSTSRAVKRPRKEKVTPKPLFVDDWCAQPPDRLFKKKYEQFVKSIAQPAPSESDDSEPESESSGLTPSEWGEMLGVITQGLEDQPLVLHCFENLEDSEDDSA